VVTKLDIIVDLQYGDSGKGKVAHFLCQTRKYTHALRYNGGSNAGHTIFHNGKKFVTHQVPAGVFYGIRSVIGNGCVVDPDALLSEVRERKRTKKKTERTRKSVRPSAASGPHIVTNTPVPVSGRRMFLR